MALVTSSPINVTLVASSIPIFILLVLGFFFYGVTVRLKATLGAVVNATRPQRTDLLSMIFLNETPEP
jgi:uncharacterized protein YacL